MTITDLLPAVAGRVKALWLLDIGTAEEHLHASPVVAWHIDEHGGIDYAVALGGQAVVVEWPDGPVHDLTSVGCRWPNRKAWVDDMRAAHAEGEEITREWLADRRRAQFEALCQGRWPAGTAVMAAQLDALDVPVEAGRPAVVAALHAARVPVGRNDVLHAAILSRRGEQPPLALFEDDAPDGAA